MHKLTKTNIIKNGYSKMLESSVVVCSIIRNCEKQLTRNIPKIEELRSKFKNSSVVIFENDSLDLTKSVLKNWSNNSHNIFVKYENFKVETIPKKNLNGVNRFYSYQRISKMVQYRNQYMSFLNDSEKDFDYVIIIDLDIEDFSIDGIAHSFGLSKLWDVITANGYSYSEILKKRYHDTYALIEYGTEDQDQNEHAIKTNRKKWSFLKPGLPLIPVFSAYGGLAIYRYKAIKNKKYRIIPNSNARIEVKCEHVSLHNDMQRDGFTRIYINPNMLVLYEKFGLSKIKNFFINKFIDLKN